MWSSTVRYARALAESSICRQLKRQVDGTLIDRGAVQT